MTPRDIVDRYALNDEITALLLRYGWQSNSDYDDARLNEIVHVIADVLDELLDDMLVKYTVVGVYEDSTEPDGAPQRYAEAFWAENPEHAEEQARNSAGETLVVAAVIDGEASVVA